MDVVKELPPGPEVPKVLNAFIEIPMGSRNKYEFDKDLQVMKLDRSMYSPVHYPADYGFVPQTLWDDGDPLDILVITKAPVHPGIVVEARPVGAVEMIDKGEDDIKIIAVNANNPLYDKVQDITDLPDLFIEEVKHFFKIYKQLQKTDVEIKEEVLGREAAEKAVLKAIKMYKENQQ